MNQRFALISLGCAKNLVNSEQMLYLLDEAGYALVPDPEGADFCIVNTCGFIDSAKTEAIDTILDNFPTARSVRGNNWSACSTTLQQHV